MLTLCVGKLKKFYRTLESFERQRHNVCYVQRTCMFEKYSEFNDYIEIESLDFDPLFILKLWGKN